MSDRTDRLLAVLVVLLALLLVSQVTVVPRNRLLSTIGITAAIVATPYALYELWDAR